MRGLGVGRGRYETSMPTPLSPRATRLFVIGMIVSLIVLITVATVYITRGMNDAEFQERIEESRQAREAGLEE